MPKRIPVIAIAVGLAVAGCGGSSSHHAALPSASASISSPRILAASQSTTAGSAPSAETTLPRSRTRHHGATHASPSQPPSVSTSSPTPRRHATQARHHKGEAPTQVTKLRSRTGTHAAHPSKVPPSSTTATSTTSTTSATETATPVATTTPNAGIPSGTDVGGPTPIDCMNQQSLTNPHAMQLEEWEARDPRTKSPIFVEGPFESNGTVDQYVQTYQGINLVAAGGIYVASAPLSSGLQTQVDALARCLRRATGNGPLGF